MRSGWTFTLTLTCAALACSKPSADVGNAATSASAAPLAPSATAVVAASTSADEPAASPSASANAIAILFGARLAEDAKKRPTGVVTVEAVVAAFKAKGANVTSTEQHLGTAYHAAYCVGGWVDATQIAFSVCEYASDKAVADGKTDSSKLAPVPNRSTHQNGRTLLFLRVATKTPETSERAKAMVDAFTALKPSAAPK